MDYDYGICGLNAENSPCELSSQELSMPLCLCVHMATTTPAPCAYTINQFQQVHGILCIHRCPKAHIGDPPHAPGATNHAKWSPLCSHVSNNSSMQECRCCSDTRPEAEIIMYANLFISKMPQMYLHVQLTIVYKIPHLCLPLMVIHAGHPCNNAAMPLQVKLWNTTTNKARLSCGSFIHNCSIGFI
jgi:hypothetical protein